MAFTPQDVITLGRQITLDTDSTYPRLSDTELLGYVNDGLKEASLLKPTLFYSVGDMTCTVGSTEQVLTFSDCQKLVDVLGFHGGANIPKCEMSILSAYNPNWQTEAQAPAINWMRNLDDDPLRFYVYPPAPAAQVLDVQYVRNPGTYTINQVITDLPDVYKPALADYVVFRVESRDDEHANSGRALAHYQKFASQFGVQQPPQGN